MVSLKTEITGIVFTLGILSVLTRNTKNFDEAIKYETLSCSHSESYIENNCNRCKCVNEGSSMDMMCNAKFCSSYKNPKFKNCVVGTTWKKSCDQCWCMEDARGTGTICTKRDCSNEYENLECNPDYKYTKNDCNNCTCENEGSSQLDCDEETCSWPNSYGPCDVGTTWKEACNKCWCLEGSEVVCTNNECKLPKESDEPY